MNRKTRTWITGMIMIIVGCPLLAYHVGVIKASGEYFTSDSLSAVIAFIIMWRGLNKVYKTID